MRLWLRISLSFVAMLAITGIIVAVIVNKQINADMQADQQRWSDLLTRAIAKSVMGDLIKHDYLAVKETLGRITKKAEDIDYVAIIDFDSQFFASTFSNGDPENLAGLDHSKCVTGSKLFNLSHDEHHAGTEITGLHKVIDYVHPMIENLDAHIHLGVRQSAIRQAINNAQNKVITIIIVVTLVVFVLALFMGRRISRPIERLTERIRVFRKNGVLIPQENQSSDLEVNELINDFEMLIEERFEYESEILKYRDHLEDRVKARTKELDSEIEQHKETAEHLLAAKEEAEKANEAKSMFLSSMSHELRTPLNAIIGFSQLQQMNLSATGEDSETLENINEVISAGQHLLSLINEVLDLARIESGKLDLSMEVVQLKTVLQESISLISKSAEKRNITIYLDDSRCDMSRVYADNVKLKQVLLNLLSNAVKYNRENGQIDITVSNDEKNCRLSVKDTGQGIAEKFQNKVFKPFERLHAENSVTEGAGIGLVITKSLIEKMNGSIGFESKEGVGSEFWIEIPLVVVSEPEKESATESEKAQLAVGERKIILYIEDNYSNISMVQKIFRHVDNIELLIAEKPSAGFKLLQDYHPDLILLDINLPEMDGYEVKRRLSVDDRTKDIKVIALSANAMHHDIEKAREFGFVDYITKPLDVYKFINTVNSYLQ